MGNRNTNKKAIFSAVFTAWDGCGNGQLLNAAIAMQPEDAEAFMAGDYMRQKYLSSEPVADLISWYRDMYHNPLEYPVDVWMTLYKDGYQILQYYVCEDGTCVICDEPVWDFEKNDYSFYPDIPDPGDVLEKECGEAQADDWGDWTLTDPDQYQWFRKLEDGVYEGYMICAMKQCFVCHEVIYADDLNVPEILECYGYESLEGMREEYGDMLDQVLAECRLELNAGCGSSLVTRKGMEYDDAVRLIDRLIGKKGENGND